MEKLLTLILATAMTCAAAQGANTPAETELRGRDIVATGTTTSLTGTLTANGHEWQLKSGETVYDIHLGPAHFREEKGLTLADGGEATVTGFLKGTDVAVSTMTIGESSFVLRDESGKPLWAGQGHRRNAKNGAAGRRNACQGFGEGERGMGHRRMNQGDGHQMGWGNGKNRTRKATCKQEGETCEVGTGTCAKIDSRTKECGACSK